MKTTIKEQRALQRLRQKMAMKDDTKPFMNPVPGHFHRTTVMPDGLTLDVIKVVPVK